MTDKHKPLSSDELDNLEARFNNHYFGGFKDNRDRQMVLRLVREVRQLRKRKRKNATIHYDACDEHLFDAPFTGAGYECLWCFVEDKIQEEGEQND
jgi:hypothetical protein